MLRRVRARGSEPGLQHALFREGCGRNDRDGRIGRQAGTLEGRSDLGKVRHRHVENDGLAGAGDRRPRFDRALIDRPVTGREDNGVVGLARRRRYAGKCGCRQPRRQPRNDAERDAGARQRQRLLAPAPEHERVAALQAHDFLAFARKPDDEIVDVGLVRRRFSTALAGGAHLGAGARQLEDARIDEGVMHDHIAFTQGMHRHQGEQARIAGSGADEPHFAGGEIGKCGECCGQALHDRPAISPGSGADSRHHKARCRGRPRRQAPAPPKSAPCDQCRPPARPLRPTWRACSG